jgi:hypothetical protein
LGKPTEGVVLHLTAVGLGLGFDLGVVLALDFDLPMQRVRAREIARL